MAWRLTGDKPLPEPMLDDPRGLITYDTTNELISIYPGLKNMATFVRKPFEMYFCQWKYLISYRWHSTKLITKHNITQQGHRSLTHNCWSKSQWVNTEVKKYGWQYVNLSWNKLSTSWKYIEGWTKWLTFRRHNFPIHIPDWKLLYFHSNLIWVYS